MRSDQHDRYDEIKKYNYVIDVRDSKPVLICGSWAQKFDTVDEALDAAETRIKESDAAWTSTDPNDEYAGEGDAGRGARQTTGEHIK